MRLLNSIRVKENNIIMIIPELYAHIIPIEDSKYWTVITYDNQVIDRIPCCTITIAQKYCDYIHSLNTVIPNTLSC